MLKSGKGTGERGGNSFGALLGSFSTVSKEPEKKRLRYLPGYLGERGWTEEEVKEIERGVAYYRMGNAEGRLRKTS